MQFSNFENTTIGIFGYSKTLNEYCSRHFKNDTNSSKHRHSVLMCVDEYLQFDADLDHDHLSYNKSGEKRWTFFIFEFSLTFALHRYLLFVFCNSFLDWMEAVSIDFLFNSIVDQNFVFQSKTFSNIVFFHSSMHIMFIL